MDQIDEIKEMIRGMMAQEMENFKEAVSNGECDETASPVVYTMLQVLLAKIEQMQKVCHDAIEDGKKSYLMDMQLEVLTDDGETVKAIHIHNIYNEPVPLPLWCDFLERLGRMTPDESVLFVGKHTERKPLIEKDKGYVITDNYGNFVPGDIFKGVDDYELQHCRSGEIIRVNHELMESFFQCVGDFDPLWAKPISPENMEMIERMKKDMEG